jgi:hypothetical protein
LCTARNESVDEDAEVRGEAVEKRESYDGGSAAQCTSNIPQTPSVCLENSLRVPYDFVTLLFADKRVSSFQR